MNIVSVHSQSQIMNIDYQNNNTTRCNVCFALVSKMSWHVV